MTDRDGPPNRSSNRCCARGAAPTVRGGARNSTREEASMNVKHLGLIALTAVVAAGLAGMSTSGAGAAVVKAPAHHAAGHHGGPAPPPTHNEEGAGDRKSAVYGKSVDLGGRRIIKTKKGMGA